MRSWLRNVLGPAGFEVAEAKDGTDALRAFRRQPADIVISDIFMPGQDGLELLRELQRDHPGLIIVVISGGGFNGNIDLQPLARRLGAAAVLRKPFSPEAALAAVRQALGTTTAPEAAPAVAIGPQGVAEHSI
jgi:DNA-binding NtrC family response regulator